MSTRRRVFIIKSSVIKIEMSMIIRVIFNISFYTVRVGVFFLESICFSLLLFVCMRKFATRLFSNRKICYLRILHQFEFVPRFFVDFSIQQVFMICNKFFETWIFYIFKLVNGKSNVMSYVQLPVKLMYTMVLTSSDLSLAVKAQIKRHDLLTIFSVCLSCHVWWNVALI